MTPRITIVIPVYNEEKTLVDKVLQIEELIKRQEIASSDIIIADSHSTDTTATLAKKLAADHEHILYYFVLQEGKGAAIKETWLAYDYDIYSFMDVDLSTDLNAFPELINELERGGDLSIGSQYIQGANTTRSLRRESTSQVYRFLFSVLFKTGISDPQCGFKAVNKKVRDNIIPSVKENGFFFDTELLVRAYYNGYQIKEIPVTWVEDSGSTVNLARDVPRFLSGLAKLKYDHWTGKMKLNSEYDSFRGGR